MEGAPLVAAETPDERRREALDTDDTKDRKEKDKKKKKNAPTIHLSRLDVERPAELAEKRKNDKKDLLGNVSLSGLGLGAKNETSHKDGDAADSKENNLPSKKQETHDDSYSPVKEAEVILEEHAKDQELAAEGSGQTEAGESIDDADPEKTEETDQVQEGEAQGSPEDESSSDEEPDGDLPTSTSTASPLSSSSYASASTPSSQGSSGSTTPPPPATPSAGSGPAASTGPVSPIPPVPPLPPATAAGFNAAPLPSPAAANMAPTAKIELAAEKPNYFWLGVGVGAVFEHIRHKKREKKQQKEFHKELGKQTNATEEVTKKQQRTEGEMRELRAKQLERAAEKRWQETHPEPVAQETSKPVAEQKSASKVGDIVTETTRAAAEVAATIPLQAAAEKAEPFTVYERQNTLGAFEAANVTAKPEAAPVAVEPQDEPVYVEEGRRVETSSWHRMEIDKATGKVVENPSIAYGEAFEAERHQELKAQADSDDAANGGLAAVSVGLLGGHAARQAVEQVGTGTGSGDGGHAPAAVPPQRPAKQRSASPASSAGVGIGLWVLLAVLVVLIFIVLK